MPKIQIETIINSKIEICFDLSRSIDLHKLSMSHTNEKAVAGRTSGLINLGEEVTWEATHFGIKQKLTSKITLYDRPFHFRDEQVSGVFKSIIHDHYFEQRGKEALMKDIFDFESPLGAIGRIANKVFLSGYMTDLLTTRNGIIKECAETEKWKSVLSDILNDML